MAAVRAVARIATLIGIGVTAAAAMFILGGFLMLYWFTSTMFVGLLWSIV